MNKNILMAIIIAILSVFAVPAMARDYTEINVCKEQALRENNLDEEAAKGLKQNAPIYVNGTLRIMQPGESIWTICEQITSSARSTVVASPAASTIVRAAPAESSRPQAYPIMQHRADDISAPANAKRPVYGNLLKEKQQSVISTVFLVIAALMILFIFVACITPIIASIRRSRNGPILRFGQTTDGSDSRPQVPRAGARTLPTSAFA